MNAQSVISVKTNENQMNHGQIINKQIQEMMDESSISWSQIDGVCVLNGPGSYTGLRISLSTAKGICYARDIPLVLINKLDLLHSCRSAPFREKSCVIIKAREDEYFTAFYSSPNKPADAFSLMTKDTLLDEIRSNSAELMFEDAAYTDDFTSFTLVHPTDLEIYTLCLRYFHEQKFADLLHSEPFYLKNVYINKTNKL